MILKENERLDDLQFDGLRLIQRTDAFRFGTDSVLLADFANPKRRELIADLGTGTGVIAILMAAHCPTASVDAVEIQEDIADMARRSVEMNQMEASVRVHCADLRDAPGLLGMGKYSLVVCNPPYGKKGGALESESDTLRTSRHAGNLDLDALCRAAMLLLKTGGRFCVVWPAPRAFEMMRAMDKNRLAPKRIRTVHAFSGRIPKLVLLDAVKGGGEMLHWLEPLVLQNDDGSYTDEWKRIYRTE